MSQEHVYPPVSLYVDGILGRCPRCGKGHMIRGLLTVAPTCEVCGLDFSFADAGDGPAIFVMTIVGFVAIAVLWYVEVTYQPSYLGACRDPRCPCRPFSASGCCGR